MQREGRGLVVGESDGEGKLGDGEGGARGLRHSCARRAPCTCHASRDRAANQNQTEPAPDCGRCVTSDVTPSRATCAVTRSRRTGRVGAGGGAHTWLSTMLPTAVRLGGRSAWKGALERYCSHDHFSHFCV